MKKLVMKKKNQKLVLGKETISNLESSKVSGGANGYSYKNQKSCGETCFVTSCGCPKSVNGNCNSPIVEPDSIM